MAGTRRRSRSRPFGERPSAASGNRRPRRPPHGPRPVQLSGRCTTRRYRHGPERAWTNSHPGLPASVTGSLRTGSFPPTWSGATATSPRRRSGPGHQSSRTATSTSNTSSSTMARSPASSTGPRPPGDALFDLATLTLAEEHLDDVIAGYGAEVDRDLIRAWRSWRCLTVIRWLFENGYGAPDEYPEVAVLRSQA